MSKGKKFKQILSNQTLLGQQKKIKEQAENIQEKKDDDKHKHNRSAKFTDLEVEQLEKIMLALGTDQVSKSLRWCLKKSWEVHGEDIEKIVKQKKKIGSL